MSDTQTHAFSAFIVLISQVATWRYYSFSPARFAVEFISLHANYVRRATCDMDGTRNIAFSVLRVIVYFHVIHLLEIKWRALETLLSAVLYGIYLVFHKD